MTRVLPRIAAALLAAVPAGAFAVMGTTLTYAANPVTLAATCDLAKPIVFVNVALHNRALAPSEPLTLAASDETGILRGSIEVPAIERNETVAVAIPLQAPGKNPATIAGPHTVTVRAGTLRTTPLLVQIPPAFCAPPPPPPPVATPAPAAVRHSRVPPLIPAPAATPAPSYIGTTVKPPSVTASMLKLEPPNNLRAAGGGSDCAAHVGPIGALVCPDMIKSGDLLLVWDWQAGNGPGDIDGYRVYRVDGGQKLLLYTRANKKDLTLADLAKPAGGYTGKCYAVSAFAASRESALSSPFCAAGGSVATTERLARTYMRSSSKTSDSGLSLPASSGMNVGYEYESATHTFKDTYHNYIYRLGIAFDVSALRDRRIVAAKLRMRLDQSSGFGNNHSCATAIGTGNEFWWQSRGWLEGQFGHNIVPTDTGPEVTADVTPIVAPWLRGEPNYGFVIKNDDENLGAFTNKTCLSTYGNPILEITYY